MPGVLLTLTARSDGTPPATDLGHLLHKHPDRVQRFEQSTGVLHVLYPQADERTCTVALLLEVDPVALVRGRDGKDTSFTLAQHVNDRPYVASSLLAVAMGRVLRSAMAGRCASRPALVDHVWDLEVRLPAVPAAGGSAQVERLFAPLGWDVTATAPPLDPHVPAWGDAPHVDLVLRGRHRVADALSHLYVLLPALDGAKHYWVGPDEVDKLVRVAGGWLADHPAREEIARRSLAHQRSLAADALARLAEVDETVPDDVDDAPAADDVPAAPSLARTRQDAVVAVLREVGARTVVDLGCGEGALVARLLDEGVDRVLGTDVSVRALRAARRRLHLDELPERVRARVDLVQSSVTYTDARVAGFDAAVLMEVVEHVDPPRLPALARAVLGAAAPATLVLTTPNAEHNVRYPTLAAGTVRHHDHRFEWTRAELAAWAHDVARTYGYDVELRPVGDDDPDVGPPTQMAVFRRTTTDPQEDR